MGAGLIPNSIKGFCVTRFIRVLEPRSGLDCRIELLDHLAPRSAAALWAIAGTGGAHFAQHAMWTGPEISCPVLEDRFPAGDAFDAIPLENATSFPAAGDIATVYAAKGTWAGMPPAALFDIGLFYGEGARLLMPMGWIMASVSGRVVADDMAAYRAACAAIRRNGMCDLEFRQDV
jgi:hypothetical protein